jgi:hypothetical protein
LIPFVFPLFLFFFKWNILSIMKKSLTLKEDRSVCGGQDQRTLQIHPTLGCNLYCKHCYSSSGPGFGDNGFFRIAYEQVKIDDYDKFGLRVTNPDPWTKRRVHSGNIIESGNGGFNNNFEMLAPGGNGKQIRHWWRDNARSGFPWAQAHSLQMTLLYVLRLRPLPIIETLNLYI